MSEFRKRAIDSIELLEELAGDLRKLADLDEDLRIRLSTASGKLSRPERYQRKNLGKVLARQRFHAKRDADRALLDQSGIRQLRKEPVFRTPLPKPEWTELELRDDSGADPWAEAEARREPRVETARM